jgi:sugar lactone lactonase YvrE
LLGSCLDRRLRIRRQVWLAPAAVLVLFLGGGWLGVTSARAATLTIATSSLPAGRQVSTYSATLAASGGTAPYHWSATGSLPPGLSLSPGGVLSGTPTATGTSSVTFKVTDSATPTSASATATLPLTVFAPLNQSMIYALNNEDSTVTEYAPSASGDATPVATLQGSKTQIGFLPSGLAVSSARKVYVSAKTPSGAAAILEFAPGANGNVAPQTVLSGSLTGLDGNDGVAVDKAGDLWVANVGNSTLTEYGPAASGNNSPRLTLGGPATGLSSPSHMTFDAAGDLWVTNPGNSKITEYAAASLQQTSMQPVNLTPAATVASTAVRAPGGITFDAVGALHVGDESARAIFGFAPGSPNGNATPTDNLAGSNTQLGFALGLAADPAGRLYVGEGAILEFNENATGNTAPVTIIQGSASGVDGAFDVAISPPPPVAYTGATQLHPTVGAQNASTLTASGGIPPYHFAVSSGTLPAGMSLTSGGVLSGVPTSAASDTVTVKITDAALPTPASTTQTLQIIPAAPAPLAVSTSSLPATAVGQGYSTTLAATGGVTPYSWALTAGALPAGLSLSSSGKIMGTPTQMGTFTFTVTGTDSAAPTHHTATVTLSLLVKVRPGVYLTNAGNDSVTGYPLGQGGDIAPFVDITGPDTGLSTPEGIALDGAGHVFVANEGNDTVTEYAPGVSGDSRPVATITGVSSPCRVALSGADLYVASLSDTISEYSVGSGTPKLIASISGQQQPRGLAVDAGGHLWVSESTVNEVNEYSPTASGAATPMASISGPDTGLASPQGLVFDPAGNLTVANAGGVGIPGSVTVYPASHLSGDSVPTTTLNSGLTEPLGVDRGTDLTVFAADVGANAIVEYPPGSTTPSEVISGPAETLINIPVSVAATPPLSILTTKLPAARQERRYLVNLAAAEGTTPYRWRVIHGRLPRGLRVRKTGAIIGTTHARVGVYRITVRVTDSTHPAQKVLQRLGLRLKPRAHPRRHRRRHGAHH